MLPDDGTQSFADWRSRSGSFTFVSIARTSTGGTYLYCHTCGSEPHEYLSQSIRRPSQASTLEDDGDSFDRLWRGVVQCLHVKSFRLVLQQPSFWERKLCHADENVFPYGHANCNCTVWPLLGHGVAGVSMFGVNKQLGKFFLWVMSCVLLRTYMVYIFMVYIRCCIFIVINCIFPAYYIHFMGYIKLGVLFGPSIYTQVPSMTSVLWFNGRHRLVSSCLVVVVTPRHVDMSDMHKVCYSLAMMSMMKLSPCHADSSS